MSVTAVRSGAAAERPAHRDPNVLRWLGAYTSSAIGDNVYYIALSWAAVQAGTPAQAGLVSAASAVPRALLMLGGGVVADRFGPRRVVVGSGAVRCALVLTAAGLLLATSPGLWALGAVAVLFGVVDAVFLPAAGALPALLAPGASSPGSRACGASRPGSPPSSAARSAAWAWPSAVPPERSDWPRC